MSDKYELIAKEDWQDVAWMARFMTRVSLDKDFKSRIEKDPEGTLQETGYPLELKDIEFKPMPQVYPMKMQAVHEGSKAEKYANFMNRKMDYVDVIRERCEPVNPAMKKWRDRQCGRCNMELGARVIRLVQAPFTMELADGCSIGCEFCGLNAGRLKSVFRYTEENAELFRGVINKAKEIIGDAAGEGTMYFATEPLDNPDYEKFLEDYLECFNELPQITTAAAMRHKDRLHVLLKQLNERNDKIYRFSVLSLQNMYDIFEEFTPEELALVELLPQFEDAPSSVFVKAGRSGEKAEEYGDTISCISGFVVNMCRKEIRLTTPTYACKEHPTGEIILDIQNFDSVEDFADVMNGMIKKYMKNILGPQVGFRIRDKVSYKFTDDKQLIISCEGGCEYNLATNDATPIYRLVLEELSKGYITRREIVDKLRKLDECKGGRTDILFYTINKLWTMGVIVADNGEI